MTKRRLSEAQVIKLINAVRQRPCIWDPEHEKHNNKYFLALAWKDISQEMSMSALFLRQKWKNLKDTLKSAKKKAPLPGWKYYDKLSFLANHCTDEKEYNKESEPCTEDVISRTEINDYIKIEVPDTEIYLKEEERVPERKAIIEDCVDYDMMFLQSLAPFFKQLEPIRKLVVRSKIQDLLVKELAVQEASNRLNLYRK